MIRYRFLIFIEVIAVVFALNPFFTNSRAMGGDVTPEQFAGEDGLLDENELIKYFLVSNKIGFDKIWDTEIDASEITPENGDMLFAKMRAAVDVDLMELEQKIGSSGPYTVAQVNEFFGIKASKEGEKSKWPIKWEDKNWRIERPQLRETYFDWSEKQNKNKKKGAIITYSEDRLEDVETWITHGSLILPINYYKKESEHFNNITLGLLPNIYWNYIKVNSEGNSKAEELSFRLPFFAALSHKVTSDVLGSWRGDIYLTPLYSTDFDFKGEMAGAEFRYEPIFGIRKKLAVGSWRKIHPNYNMFYHIRMIPGFNYCQVLSECEYINRKKNDEILGATFAFELVLKPFRSDYPWELRFNYDMLYDFKEESDEYMDLWKTSATYWVAESLGLTFSYERGDMFLANKQIDLMTLGLEVLY